MKFVAEALNLAPPAAERLGERNILKSALIKHPFFGDVIEAYKLEKKFGEYEEGTLIAKTRDGLEVVRGYPKIRRALTLYPTIKRRFRGDVALEEKMNGYNARIALLGENIYGITRRGYICPYTTEKARELIDMAFFHDYPHLMLCCEAVGEESPFVPKTTYGVKIDFYVFDIREKRTNKPLSIKEKVRLCEEYSLNMAPILEVVDAEKAHKVAFELVKKLGEEGREGIVFKDVEMKREPIKYTSSQSNCGDLRYAFRYFNDYGRDFMFSRIVREGFQSFELKESEEEFRERCLRLGMSILQPMIQSIKEVAEGKKITEKTRLSFSSMETLRLFKEHVRRMGIEAIFGEVEERDGKYVVTFERVMVSTTDKIKGHLKGGLW